MKKRIISLVLVLCMICSLIPMTASATDVVASGTCGENLTWNLDSDGTLTISGSGKMYDWDAYEYESYMPPWAEYASSIQQVVIKDGVTDIGDCAFFECENLTSVLLPDSVTSIGNHAFDTCKSMNNIDLPLGLISIGQAAFVRCANLRCITIPENVTDIWGSVFNGCTNLTEVYFTGPAPYFYDSIMFSGVVAVCYYPAGDDSWNRFETENYGGTLMWFPRTADIASGICGSNTTWALGSDGKLIIAGTGTTEDWSTLSETPWYQHRTQINSVVIGPGITYIGNIAFSDCKDLKHVYFTYNAPSFGDNTFLNVSATCFYASSNSSWTDSVKQNYGGELTWVAFTDLGFCGDHLTWTLDEIGKLTILGNGDMLDWNDDDFNAPWHWPRTQVKYVVIESGVTSIGQCAFDHQEALESITTPESITTIGIGAFQFSSLRSIAIPNSVTSIGACAFWGCDELKDIVLPDGITSIEDSLFESCSISSVTIPDSVTSIGSYAFYNCTNLKRITLPDNLASIGSDAFSSSGLQSLTVPDKVTSIEDYAFAVCLDLSEITFVGNAPTLGDNAFKGVTATCYYPDNDASWIYAVNKSYGGSLTWVPYEGVAADDIGVGIKWSIRDGVLTISGNGAMKDFDSYSDTPWYTIRDEINTVVIERGVISIGSYAFGDCISLTNIDIADSVSNVGEHAFDGCSSLREVIIPSSITTIGDFAFCNESERTNATNFTISDLAAWCQISWGSANALPTSWELSLNGELLTSVTIPASISSISDYAFWNNDSLTDVTIPGNIASIGSNAFGNCSNLASVTLQEGVQTIEDSSFSGCQTLSNVILPQSIASIGKGAFSDCSFESIVLPNELTEIKEGTFRHCPLLARITFGSHISSISHYAFAYCESLANVYFASDMPAISDSAFEDVTAKAYYPCDKTGWESYKLLNYGGMLSWEKVHGEYIASTIAPTCTDKGYTSHTCACGDSYKDSEVAALGHSEVTDKGYAATCTKEGLTDGSHCDRCSTVLTKQETIPAQAHTWNEGVVTKEPTEEETGIRTYTCTVCGESKNESIPELDHTHSYMTVTTAPTCTEDGYTTYTCICGDTYTDDEVAALGHTEVTDVAVPATCTKTGLTEGSTCSVCGEILIAQEETPMVDHCYVDGICSVCGMVESTTSPNAPVILSCYSKLQTSVKVTWTIDENADGYELWRTATPDDEDSWIKAKTITSGTTDRYTNQGLEVGVTYYYKIRAYADNADGTRSYSEFSNVDYMPAAVVFDGPYSNATSRIRLRWNEVGGAHGYQIWRMNEDGSWKIVKTLGDKGNELTNDQGGTTAYSNTGLVAGNTYTYKMRAFMITEDGKKVFGAYSDEYSVAVRPDVPMVAGSSSKATRAKLTWDAVNGAAGYQIWMSESVDGEYKIVKSVTDGSTSYTKYDLTSGKTYYFKVRAYAEAQERKAFSAYSEVVAITIE